VVIYQGWSGRWTAWYGKLCFVRLGGPFLTELVVVVTWSCDLEDVDWLDTILTTGDFVLPHISILVEPE